MPAIDEVLDGRYQIISEIGSGGAGVVFLGYHLTLHKYVVVKKLKEQFTQQLNIRGEADILKRLHHRYLPQVYDFLVIDGEIFTVMDYVDGRDLNWYVENGIVFSEQELTRMLLQLCEVLEYLHGQCRPIIHRDIKPGNIMLRENGDVCLIDFNISFSEGSQAGVGYSYHYAAPEQMETVWRTAQETQQVMPDARSDLYSLGATFFYLMTGVRPRDPQAQQLLKGSVKTAYPADLFRIIQKSMAHDPGKRYDSAGRMKRAVENRAGRVGRILQWAVGGVVVLLAVLGIMAGVIYNRNRREEVFAAAYTDYVETLSAGDTQSWIYDGIALLNRSELEDVFEQKPAQKAVVLEHIAAGYYEAENYGEAAAYYREALAVGTDPVKRAANARDLVLSLIRGGKPAEAQQALEEYQSELPAETLRYVEAEFYLQKGEREKALERIDSLLASAGEREILLRCCLYGAECLEGTGQYERRLAYLNRAEQYLDTPLLYRTIGDGFLKIAQEVPEESAGETAVGCAAQCYEKLCAHSQATYVDQLNLAVLWQMEGKPEDAMEVLLPLMEEAPEDYRAYREAAFARYQMEQKKAEKNRSSQPVLYYGRLAFAYYDEKNSDEQMIRLRQLMDRLTTK